MNKKKLTLVAIVFAALFFAMGPRAVYADGVSVNVSVDTSALPSTPGSEIFLIFTDGSGIGDSNNTATMSGFGFGGGSAGTVDSVTSTGGASGDLNSTVSMIDSSFTNIFAETFTAGSSISFLLNLTANVDAGPTPDQFSLEIMDPNGNFIPATDPTGVNLLVINLDSANPVPTAYSNLVTLTPAGPVATPEPPAGVLVVIALLALTFFSRKRRTDPRSLAK